MLDNKKKEKQELRLLKVLSRKSTDGCKFEKCDGRFAIVIEKRRHHFDQSIIDTMMNKGLVSTSDFKIRLTFEGLEALRNRLGLNAGEKSVASVAGNSQQKKSSTGVSFNKNESPLMRLYLRKTGSGKSYLTSDEFQAGERFRQDFERSQLQPRITASYAPRVAGLSRAYDWGGSADISDFAIDARKRVSCALEILGPHLAGVAMDICCFLKGFELVERERRWPPRSAKLMLKTALSMLANHYGFSSPDKNSEDSIGAWGSPDYKPSLML